MGGRVSCCSVPRSPHSVVANSTSNNDRQVSRRFRSNDSNHLHEESPAPTGRNAVPHISEREVTQEDIDTDPSINPMVGSLFIQKSRSDLSAPGSAKSRRSHLTLFENRPLKKSNSCSTIYLDDSTVSQPNLKCTLKCVTLAMYYHMRNRTTSRIMDIFDERKHPLNREEAINLSGAVVPYVEHRIINRFVRTLFSAALLSAECAIVTLIYLERLLTYAELDLTPVTWRRMVLGAILLASKVWDDQAVWNVDYCQILKEVTVDDMNELERIYLELIQFNINVPASVYAKYYFDLRTLAEQNGLSFPPEPLSRSRAERLEALSRSCNEKFVYKQSNGGCMDKKWPSLDNVAGSHVTRRSTVILS